MKELEFNTPELLVQPVEEEVLRPFEEQKRNVLTVVAPEKAEMVIFLAVFVKEKAWYKKKEVRTYG